MANDNFPKDTRGFYDPVNLRKAVLTNAKEAFEKKLNAVESKNYQLKVTNIEYPKEDMHFTVQQQKDAILNRSSLTVPLKAHFSLVHKPTDTIVAQKSTIVAHVPWVTNRNTCLLNGSEYVVVNQQRLLPGVYTRQKESGEIEAHLNVLPGTGIGGHIVFYPEKQIFMYKIQNTQVPLYGILKEFGVSDSAIQSAWGSEIYLKNKASYTGTEIDKLYDKLFTK